MSALVKWWNTHTLSVRGLSGGVRTAIAATVVLSLAGYAFTVATWGRSPLVERDDWGPTAIAQPQLSRAAALMALLGLAAGSAMLTAASAGTSRRTGRLIRFGVAAAGVSYGGMHAVMCTGLVWEPPGVIPAYAVFAALAWAAVAVLPTAWSERAASGWTGPAAASAPYAAGLAVTLTELAYPRIGFAWSVIALQPFTLLAFGGVGLLLAGLAAQGAFAAVETGRWVATKTARFRWPTAILIGLACAVGVWWVFWWTAFDRVAAALAYTVLLAVLSIGLFAIARHVDVPDADQPRLALALATLFFLPVLGLPAVGAPLVGVPAMISRPGPATAVVILGVAWLVARRLPRRRSTVVRAASVAVATVVAMLLERFVPLTASKAMADPIGKVVSEFMGGVRAVLMLGFDEPFRPGLVYIGLAALAMLPWRRTRPLGLAAVFLFAWNLPWWWGFTVSARHFAVFAAVLLTLLYAGRLFAGRLFAGRMLPGRMFAGRMFGLFAGRVGRIEAVTIVMAIWVFTAVAWVSRATDLIPDGWSRWTVPLALITPVLIPLLLQAQPLNADPGRRERILITCGIGTAAVGLVLFFTVMGLWRVDLPWGLLAGIFLTMPFGVIAVASASVPDSSPAAAVPTAAASGAAASPAVSTAAVADVP